MSMEELDQIDKEVIAASLNMTAKLYKAKLLNGEEMPTSEIKLIERMDNIKEKMLEGSLNG